MFEDEASVVRAMRTRIREEDTKWYKEGILVLRAGVRPLMLIEVCIKIINIKETFI